MFQTRCSAHRSGFGFVCIIFAALVTTACGTSEAAQGSPPSAPSVQPTTTTPPTNTPDESTSATPPPETPATAAPVPSPPATQVPTTTVKVPAPVQERASNALSAHLGVVSTTLTLTAAEPQEWPDGALGCPEEGRMYMQVIIPGYRLVFESAAGQAYPVHTDETADMIILCQDEQPASLAQ